MSAQAVDPAGVRSMSQLVWGYKRGQMVALMIHLGDKLVRHDLRLPALLCSVRGAEAVRAGCNQGLYKKIAISCKPGSLRLVSLSLIAHLHPAATMHPSPLTPSQWSI